MTNERSEDLRDALRAALMNAREGKGPGEGEVHLVTTHMRIDPEDMTMDRTVAVLDADGVDSASFHLPPDPAFGRLRLRLAARDSAVWPWEGR